MKIQIIGLGIVGTAQAYLSQKLGHEVVGYDSRPISHPYCKVNNGYIKDADITFICTPEAAVEEVVNNLSKMGYKGVIAIRSTIPLGTVKQLKEKFDMHVCHNPEFLKEKEYLEDIMNPNMIVIGQCCTEHGKVLKDYYRPMEDNIEKKTIKKIIVTDTTTSEIIKLTMNSYLSVLITFWNEINQISDKLGVDIKTVAETVKLDPRMSKYGNKFFGEPYAGKCLPKDVRHFIAGFRINGLNPKIFEACESFNEKLIKDLEKSNKDKK